MYWAQVYALLLGMIFAWTTIVFDFISFYETEGTLLKINDCLYPNPVTTACFYGAIAFTVAFIWSVLIIGKEVEVRKKSEKHLMYLLIAGSIFAWSNFGFLVYRFYTALPGQGVGCSGVPASSPFTTACFYGSMIFLIALVVSIILFVKDRTTKTITI